MSFTPEHIETLEKYREHWDTLTGAGYMRNLDEPVKRELQRIFNEAVGPQRFTLWCNDCVVDMVRLLYTNYELWVSVEESISATRQRHLDHIAATEQRIDDAIHEELMKPKTGLTTFDGVLSAMIDQAGTTPAPTLVSTPTYQPPRKRKRR